MRVVMFVFMIRIMMVVIVIMLTAVIVFMFVMTAIFRIAFGQIMVMKMEKALKEKHLQDALQAYRHKWGATLGDYLRGPQQNLRFLLPLVYRNQVMTTRLTEAILLGKGMVR